MNSTAPRTPLSVLASTLGFRVSQGTPKNIVADALLLGTRLFAGVWMAQAGLDKLPTPDWMIDQVTQVGFPAPHFFAVCAEMAEYAGGLLLALGLFTRPAAFFLVFTMGVAAFGFHGVRPILDYHITQGFLWLYVALLVVGPGRLSLDHLFSRVSTSSATGDTKPKRYILLGALVSAPIIGYGLFREFTMTWEPDPEQASTATMDGVETISLAGSFNDWDVNATPLIEGDDGVWSTTVTLDEGLTELKFVANGSWDLNMGDDDQTASAAPFSGIGDLDADNIRVFIQTPGDYRVSLDTGDFSYTIEQAEPADPNDLIGTWRIELRPTPDASPSIVDLVVESIDGSTMTGTFYNGSEMTETLVSTTFGAVQFAFVTSDGSGLYHTSGTVLGNTMTGQTHALERGFMMPWTGTRIKEP